MSKGIKMRAAQDRHGHRYTVEELQRMTDGGGTAPDLRCDDPSCRCDVRFVPRYQQHRANRIEPVDVPAYIGLTRGSEHAAGCRYDASGRLKIIAAQSDPEFVRALGDGKRELRLLALHNGLRKSGLSGHAPETNPVASSASRPKTSTEVALSDKKLDSYLRTTADLVALRAMCETDTLLASELVLRLGTQRIPWKQFFFEHERFDEAWETVTKGGDNPYPIALSVTVRSIHRPPVGAKYKSSFLNGHALYRKTDDPLRIQSFEISVAHVDGAWLNSFAPETELVLFGLWKADGPIERTAPDKRERTRTITYVTYKLTLTPKFKKQAVSVS
ncbi:hypothetical protein [Burkholderia cenocepacia]|jgi:hypothetical protein|uniref:hypothetical protein n=1 Tax=Burkholderia cenocepacia TaxID=95486 RepID=UPI0024B7E8B6|nr:hypothetical protein [Burkholderia cenocepacia]MDI9689736.1 hypothetical protein [Burkholderia cenocepacia]